MSLPYGATDKANEDLAFLLGLRINLASYNLQLSNDSWCASINAISGDCTACSIDTDGVSLLDIPTVYETMLKFMSLNGRTSCFFSKFIDETYCGNVEEFIKSIQHLPIVGLHKFPSIRSGAKYQDHWMVSGILKCPNPQMKGYNRVAFDPAYDFLKDPVYTLIGE